MNGPSHASTSSPYPSALLNEVHHYFPALLYDAGRFNNVTDVFNYVGSQMRQNFDLFTNARNAFMQSEGLQTPARSLQRHHPVQYPEGRSLSPPMRQQRTVDTSPLRNATPLSQQQQQQQQEEYENGLVALTNILSSLINPRMTPTMLYTWGGEDLEPVPVRPSASVLEQATTVSVLASSSDNNCTVCQDTMEQGATVRKINACTHTFHRTCIDTWFQTNVHCPTCRHDVRSNTNSR